MTKETLTFFRRMSIALWIAATVYAVFALMDPSVVSWGHLAPLAALLPFNIAWLIGRRSVRRASA